MGGKQTKPVPPPAPQIDKSRTINQASDGVSLVNFHWASFGTGIGFIAFLALGIILCVACLWYRNRQSKKADSRHKELVAAFTKSSPGHAVPETACYTCVMSAGTCNIHSKAVLPLYPNVQQGPSGTTWIRSPMGWNAVQSTPPAPAVGFPGYPPSLNVGQQPLNNSGYQQQAPQPQPRQISAREIQRELRRFLYQVLAPVRQPRPRPASSEEDIEVEQTPRLHRGRDLPCAPPRSEEY